MNSVTTAKASTPVAINAIAAVLEVISLALLLTNSVNVGLNSGEWETYDSGPGKIINYTAENSNASRYYCDSGNTGNISPMSLNRQRQ